MMRLFPAIPQSTAPSFAPEATLLLRVNVTTIATEAVSATLRMERRVLAPRQLLCQ